MYGALRLPALSIKVNLCISTIGTFKFVLIVITSVLFGAVKFINFVEVLIREAISIFITPLKLSSNFTIVLNSSFKLIFAGKSTFVIFGTRGFFGAGGLVGNVSDGGFAAVFGCS